MDCDGVQIGSETWELSCGRVKGIQPLRFFQAFQEVHWRQVFCEVFDEIHVQISDRMTFVIRIFFEASLEIGLCGKRGNDSQ